MNRVEVKVALNPISISPRRAEIKAKRIAQDRDLIAKRNINPRFKTFSIKRRFTFGIFPERGKMLISKGSSTNLDKLIQFLVILLKIMNS
jgi:hypothetical protein